MSHKRLALRNANWLFATALMLCMTLFAKADNTFSSSDNNLSFSYPRRWKADMSGDKVQLTPSDGSHYLLQINTIETFKGESPATDPELKLKIGKLVQTLSDRITAQAPSFGTARRACRMRPPPRSTSLLSASTRYLQSRKNPGSPVKPSGCPPFFSRCRLRIPCRKLRLPEIRAPLCQASKPF